MRSLLLVRDEPEHQTHKGDVIHGLQFGFYSCQHERLEQGKDDRVEAERQIGPIGSCKFHKLRPVRCRGHCNRLGESVSHHSDSYDGEESGKDGIFSTSSVSSSAKAAKDDDEASPRSVRSLLRRNSVMARYGAKKALVRLMPKASQVTKRIEHAGGGGVHPSTKPEAWQISTPRRG